MTDILHYRERRVFIGFNLIDWLIHLVEVTVLENLAVPGYLALRVLDDLLQVLVFHFFAGLPLLVGKFTDWNGLEVESSIAGHFVIVHLFFFVVFIDHIVTATWWGRWGKLDVSWFDIVDGGWLTISNESSWLLSFLFGDANQNQTVVLAFYRFNLQAPLALEGCPLAWLDNLTGHSLAGTLLFVGRFDQNNLVLDVFSWWWPSFINCWIILQRGDCSSVCSILALACKPRVEWVDVSTVEDLPRNIFEGAHHSQSVRLKPLPLRCLINSSMLHQQLMSLSVLIFLRFFYFAGNMQSLVEVVKLTTHLCHQTFLLAPGSS